MGSPTAKDMKIPPRNSPQDKSGFAYKSLKDTLPVIVVKTIDFLHRQRKDLHKYGGTIYEPNEVELAEIEGDAKELIARLAKLRKEMETNRPFQLVEKHDLSPELQYLDDDVDLWNEYIEAHKVDVDTLPRWYDSPWLLVECYLYRKIIDEFLKTKHLKLFDPYVEQKKAVCISALSKMTYLASHMKEIELAINKSNNKTHPLERLEFTSLMQLALWSNKCDLSFHKMDPNQVSSKIRDHTDALRDNILCDNLSEVWFKILSVKDQVQRRMAAGDKSDSEHPIYIDLVADNAAYEIFVDLCLLHFLSLMMCPSQPYGVIKFRIHVKRIPWFVSDTMKKDIHSLVDYMVDSDKETSIQILGNKWRSFLSSGFWEIREHKFWQLPLDYSVMRSVAGDLHSELAKSSLIIFKGDLNYRKLVGDMKWHILTPFRTALREFMPAPLVALRTIKCEVTAGIEDINIFARINNNELPRDWMTSGNYGLIQYMDPL